MAQNQTVVELESLLGNLVLATAVLERSDDAEWSIYWQNEAARVLWGEYDVDEDFDFKLNLMDCMSKSDSSSFNYQMPNTIHAYRFTVSPQQDRLFIQFLPDETLASFNNESTHYDSHKIALESANLGVFEWSLSKDYLSYSAKVFDLCELSAVEIGNTKKSFFARLHPEDVKAVQDALDEHIDSNWPFNVEVRIRASANNYVWVNITAQSVMDENDSPINVVGLISNITERKSVEATLKQREELIEQVLDSLPLSIYVKDSRGCFRFFSKQTEVETGINRSKAIGRTDFEVYPIDLARTQVMGDQIAKDSGKIVMTEEQVSSKDEEPKWLMLGKGPLEVANNGKDETWVLGFSLDITKRREAEELLKQAKLDAENVAQAKSDFLSVMSHEIRTPLNSVIGTSSLLMEKDLNEDQAFYANIIKSSGEHLLHLVNDILDFNKLEAGKMELESRAVNLQTQAQTAVQIIETTAKLKGLPVRFEYAESMSDFYKGDESRLRQIFLNLLSNAVKFTESGEVVLKMSVVNSDKDISRVRFAVQDSGIGIPEDKIDDLFSEFTQVDASTTRKFGGTGLGLSICKKLVEAMKGEIGIFSTLGEGSTFWFEIPMLNVSDKEAQVELMDDLPEVTRELSILVAEDNMPNQLLIKAILSKLGHKITLVGDGQKAVDAVSANDGTFDLILMDMQMPIMGGIEATEAIRALPVSVARLPIIALTANVMSGDRIKAIDAGMNDFLTKPIDIAALKMALKVWSRFGNTSGV